MYAVSRARSQRPALLQAAAETTGKVGCSLSSSLQRGWFARMATRWSSHRPTCSLQYRSPHVSSWRKILFYGRPFETPSPFTVFAGRYLHGRHNRRSSFCSGSGEILVTIMKFGKPLFADMRHRVYAVAEALRKPNVASPHPDVSTGWPVM